MRSIYMTLAAVSALARRPWRHSAWNGDRQNTAQLQASDAGIHSGDVSRSKRGRCASSCASSCSSSVNIAAPQLQRLGAQRPEKRRTRWTSSPPRGPGRDASNRNNRFDGRVRVDDRRGKDDFVMVGRDGNRGDRLAGDHFESATI